MKLGTVTYLTKPILNINIEDAAKLMNKAFKKRQDVAYEYFCNGLDGKITTDYLRKADKTAKETGDFAIFNKNGNLTKESKQCLKIELDVLGLPRTATINDYFKALDGKVYF